MLPTLLRKKGRYWPVLAAVAAACASQAAAQERLKFSCDKKQENCEIESKDMTVGDKIIFLDDKDRLLARGEIVKLNMGLRIARITKRWGPIIRKARIKVITIDMQETYKTFKDGTNRNLGVALGLASYDIGSDVVGFEFGGYYEFKVFKQMKAVGRGQVWTGSGVVNRAATDGSSGTEDGNIKFTGFSGLGGVAYTLLDGQDLSFRGEIGLGLIYLSADVDGDNGAVADGGYSTGIKHGIGVAGRLDVSASYNVDFARMFLYVSQNYFQSAAASIFGVGFIWDVD